MKKIIYYKKLTVILITILVGFAKIHAQVVGGSNVIAGSYPWMVSLSGNGLDLCGGSLIAPEWVLTAGHCGQGLPGFFPTPDKVYVNLHDRSNPSVDSEPIQVSQIFVYPGYQVFSGGVDLALLKLSTPSTKVPISIANQNDAVLYNSGTTCKVLGWGDTGAGPSTTLKEADITVIDFNSCQSSYLSGGQAINGSVLCAGYISPSSQSGAASGDSGGPLVVSDGVNGWKQIGIVSGGHGPLTTEEYPGLYTKVMNYTQWIDSVIAANTPVATSVKNTIELRSSVTAKFDSECLVLTSSKNMLDLFTITIYDVLGKLVYTESMVLPIGEKVINVQNLNSGAYVTSITSKRGDYYRFKFVKTQ